MWGGVWGYLESAVWGRGMPRGIYRVPKCCYRVPLRDAGDTGCVGVSQGVLHGAGRLGVSIG